MKTNETMKIYSTPKMKQHYPNMVIMMDKGSAPNDDEILGKSRKDYEEENNKQDPWAGGLW